MPSLSAYVTLPVTALRPGMFVVDIVRQSGTKEIASCGYVRSDAQIRALAQQGVQEVRIDPSRTRSLSPNVTLTSAAAEEPQRGEGGTLRIRRLYQEARTLQVKLLSQLKQGESIDVAPLARVAEEMVDTMFTHGDAMLCLARIRAKDAYLMEHSMNVAILLASFGRHLGLERDTLKQLTLGGLLHDVGKIMTPNHILNKPGKLTDAEFAIMREHVVHSREILSQTAGITPVMLEVAANHHERLDGSGYPLRLHGEQLSLYSRMSAIVDVYDAVTADRVYKQGMEPTQAFRILLKGAGSHFDAELVHRFIKCLGVYPVGSLVRLSNQRLAIVMERNEREPLKPRVKVIYHATARHYLDVKMLDLARPGVTETIEGVAEPRDYGIQLERFIA
ncbi:HD-GYP domain-containing protein [Aeromonas simiae]|uniref:HD-GYP domain-containing protein n=1 Tax=Aeromonas simiae TaxID=218936 RepID=UPI0005A77F44|nr:HD-GYP domain-containing protein [Aeromonas simiae]